MDKGGAKAERWYPGPTRGSHCMSCHYWGLNDLYGCIHCSKDSQCFSTGQTTPRNCHFPWWDLDLHLIPLITHYQTVFMIHHAPLSVFLVWFINLYVLRLLGYIPLYRLCDYELHKFTNVTDNDGLLCQGSNWCNMYANIQTSNMISSMEFPTVPNDPISHSHVPYVMR